MLRRSGHGAIFLIGLTDEQIKDPDMPIEHQVHLAEPVPLQRWLRHLLGLAKSDGAVIGNDRLETCQFRPASPPLRRACRRTRTTWAAACATR